MSHFNQSHPQYNGASQDASLLNPSSAICNRPRSHSDSRSESNSSIYPGDLSNMNYILQQSSYDQSSRLSLPQLNTDCNGVSATQSMPGPHFHTVEMGISWPTPQMTNASSTHRPIEANGSEPNFDITQPPFNSFQLSPSISHYVPSPPHSNAPSSPSGSSGYHSASPYIYSQPLTPMSGTAGVGNSPISSSPYISQPNLPDNSTIIASRSYQFTNPSPSTPPKQQGDLPTYIDLGPYIPQDKYIPHTSSDRRRYVEDVSLEGPIVFQLDKPNQRGIPLRDALTSRFMSLVGRDDLMFVNRGPSISIRLQWVGYQPWSRQIPTRDFRSPPGPITRSKLAKNVAKSVQRFIEEHQHSPIEAGPNAQWQVGPGYIDVDDLLLDSLHHVSMGSWQAHLRLNRPLR